MASRTSCLFLGAVALLGTAAAAEGACPSGTEVGRLVSMIGNVRINGEPPIGELPFVPICAGDLITVGSQSRAGIYLLEADTPLRLDQDTVARIGAAEEPDSGLFDLSRGAIYFLSQVRRTLTIRTPYVNAGIEGTEVYLRVREAAAELIVLEGQVALAPGAATATPFVPTTVATGDRADVSASGAIARTTLPSPGGRFGALREVAVGALSWTLFYPDVLTEADAAQYPRIAQAARLLAAGQVGDAEAVLAAVPATGTEAGLAAALRAIIAVGRKDTAAAAQLADRAIALAPASPVPRLALSYTRQLALDLDGAFAVAEEAARLGPEEPLPRARLAEIHLMRGETRQARQAAGEAVRFGGGPLAQMVLGFAELAALRGTVARAAFSRTLTEESWNPLALMGLGLAHIKLGDLASGTRQIESAVAHDPGSSLLRSYLGRAFFQSKRSELAAVQYEIAKELDPSDPTPWFYDAIRLQLANRPIQALADLERSIELNDRRAQYRSPVLLEEDSATRGASLGRIYNDLGFTQLGVNEAARALARVPTSSSAHRFLADLYLGEPRREIARVSELLQAQLMQPVGLNPIQPTLAYTDLNTVQESGPARITFNEYTRVFQQDGVQITGTGLVGSQTTLGNEITATALQGTSSFSIGQYHFQADGYRDNNSIKHDILSAFTQSALTESLSAQLELQWRRTNQGDRSFFFDDFDPELDADVSSQSVRGGAFWQVTPSSSLTVSAIAAERDDATDTTSTGISDGVLTSFGRRDRFDDSGTQLETRLDQRFGRLSIVAGGGAASGESRFAFRDTKSPCTDDCVNSDSKSEGSEAHYGFFYSYASLPGAMTVTAGGAIASVDQEGLRQDQFLPKLGLEWRAFPWISFRAAAFETLNRSLVLNQTIEPTQVAGFNQLYDEFDGTRATTKGLGVDLRPTKTTSFGGEMVWRETSVPLIFDLDDGSTAVELTDLDDRGYRLYGYQVIGSRWALSLEFAYDNFRQSARDAGGLPIEIDTLRTPLSLRYFHPSGLFAVGTATYLRQSVTSAVFPGDGNGPPIRESSDDDALFLDVVGGYRSFRHNLIASVELRNFLDSRVRFQDNSFRTVQPLNPAFAPKRVVFARFTITF